MTAEFNITIPGAEIIKRLADLETQHTDLLDRLKQLELTVSANAHQQDALHDRFIALERNNESIGAYTQRLETDLGERLTAIDRARARGDDGQHDLVTRTANSIYAEIKKLEQRISDCELAVGTDKLDGAPTPNIPANDPEPPVDTAWHPYDVLVDGVVGNRPPDDRRVVAMTRSGLIDGPFKAQHAYWDERGVMTIVAWRYAKEGE